MLFGDLRQLQIVVYGSWTASFVLLDVLHLVRAGTVELVIPERDAGCIRFRRAARHVHRRVIVTKRFLICGRCTACAGRHSACLVGQSHPCERWWRARLTTNRPVRDGASFERLHVVLHSRFGRFLATSVQRTVAGTVRSRVHRTIVQVGNTLALDRTGYAHATDSVSGMLRCSGCGCLCRTAEDRVVHVFRRCERVLPIVVLLLG